MPIYRETDPLRPPRQLRAVTAAGAPSELPDEWFDDPKLDRPTPLTVTADGRVFGHLAIWGTRHIGMPGYVTPPRSSPGYGYYRTGLVVTASGKRVPVGQITLAGGHAPLHADASAAAKHYGDTASAVADVAAGEDAHGIWFSGAVRPGTTPEQLRTLQASALSGDWRPIGGRLELIAACCVNTPGFPIARAMAASGAPDEITALVAAGASDLWFAKYRDLDYVVAERVAALEEQVAALTASAADARREQLRLRVRRAS
jgi:hypothetical protein